jgi:pimeloyl-ACP methyl ester carboxylesterase
MTEPDDLDANDATTPAIGAGVLLLRLGAWLAAVPWVVVVLLVLTGPPTWSGLAYVLGMGALLWSLITLPVRGRPPVFGVRRPRGLARGAVLALVAIAVVRGWSGRAGNTLAMSPDARLVSRIVDEQDIALAGTRVLVAGGMLADDRAELTSAMREGYRTMRAEQGDGPSPVVATYLGLQSPDAFDLIIVEPRRGAASAPRDAVIFLHGFAGGFTLPCWQMARAVTSLDVLIACPSTRWVGDWWSSEGERTVRRTVDELHRRGVTRIILAGLSNGGYGASRLAPRMRGSFSGLILLSGATASAGQAGVPVLLVHGRHDTMAPFADANEYAAGHVNSRVVALEAGHFSMLVRHEENDRAVRAFVTRIFGQPSARVGR